MESIVLFVKKQDFERVQKPFTLPIKTSFNSFSSVFEGILKEFNQWSGVDENFLLYHLSDFKDEGFNTLAMKILKVIKEN